jgi:hypothetical protein
VVVIDGALHIVSKKIAGLFAACGAGRIVQLVAGRFDPEDARSCPECRGAGGG